MSTFFWLPSCLKQGGWREARSGFEVDGGLSYRAGDRGWYNSAEAGTRSPEVNANSPFLRPMPHEQNIQDPQAFEEEVARLIQDFEQRTLKEMHGQFSRLIYLASLRDYNTGRYHHYGLETRHPSPAVHEGLHRCHVKIFDAVVAMPLQEQTEELLNFFETLREDPSCLVETWERLRAYQILPPEDALPLARTLFDKNIEVMLKVLKDTDLWPLLHDPHRDPDDLP